MQYIQPSPKVMANNQIRGKYPRGSHKYGKRSVTAKHTRHKLWSSIRNDFIGQSKPFKDVVEDHCDRCVSSGPEFQARDQNYPLRKAVVHHGKN